MTLFTPTWLKALLRGKRASGETFWVGNYGTALFHQPLLALLLVMPISNAAPALLASVLAVYQGALALALVRSKPGVPTPIGWKIAGVIATLVHAALFATLANGLVGQST